MHIRSNHQKLLLSSTFSIDGSNNDNKTALDDANSSESSSLGIDLTCCFLDTWPILNW